MTAKNYCDTTVGAYLLKQMALFDADIFCTNFSRGPWCGHLYFFASGYFFPIVSQCIECWRNLKRQSSVHGYHLAHRVSVKTYLREKVLREPTGCGKVQIKGR